MKYYTSRKQFKKNMIKKKKTMNQRVRQRKVKHDHYRKTVFVQRSSKWSWHSLNLKNRIKALIVGERENPIVVLLLMLLLCTGKI